MQLTEDTIIDEFVTWAEDHIDGDNAEYLDGADEATATFISPDKGHVCIDGVPFCKWQSSANGEVSFTQK